MKVKLAMVAAIAIGAIVLCNTASAHHGNAAYNMSKLVELKNATVTSFLWANPHTVLMFDMKDDSGKVVHWAAEAGSPSAISPFGFTRDTVHPGDVITVYVWAAKAGTPVGILNKIVLADGRVFKDVPLGGTDAERDEARRQGKGIQVEAPR